jgi:hypothetical protein
VILIPELEEEINELKMSDRTDICPECGYTDGFHVSFKVELGVTKIILICPDCHARFDPGWKVNVKV